MKITTAVLFCMVNIFAADTLHTDYNLGRLPLDHLVSNGTVWGMYEMYDSYNVIFETVHYTSAIFHNVSIGCTPLRLVSVPWMDVSFLSQAFPEIDISYRSPGSNSLRLAIQPANLYTARFFTIDESGFDLPFTMVNKITWEYLGCKGEIPIEPSQYEMTFIYGPQLSPGQFRNTLDATGTLNADTVPYRKYEGQIAPQLGLPGGFQLKSTLSYSYVDSVADERYTYSFIKTKPYFYPKETIEQYRIKLGLEWRKSEFMASFDGGIFEYHDRWNSREFLYYNEGGQSPGFREITRNLSETFLNLSTVYLAGERIMTAREIEGNWNGFESQWLGEGQLLGRIDFKYVPSAHYHLKSKWANENSIDSVEKLLSGKPEVALDTGITYSNFKLMQQARYGVFSHLEVGERYSLIWHENTTVVNRFGLTLASCNITLRQYGPAYADDMEYFYGITPKKNQYFAFMTWYLPLFPERDSSYHQRLEEVLKPISSVLNHRNMFGYQHDMVQYPVFGSNSDNYFGDIADFVFSAGWALTDAVAVSNYALINWYEYETFVSSSKATVFSDFFTAYFAVTPSIKTSLSALYALQTGSADEYFFGFYFNLLAVIKGKKNRGQE